MKGSCRTLFALALILCLLLTGCSSEQPEESQTVEDDDTIEIGMCFDSYVIERWEKDRDVFVSTARGLGAEVNVQNANGEVSKQIEQIEYFINKGVDAIVIICIDGDALQETVKKAKNKGIRVIAYDRLINNSDVDLYVSFDNEMVGTLMAEALADASADIENPRVLMLQGSPTDNNVEQVREGFCLVAEERGLEIVDSMYCDGWRAEDASDYLYENPDILDNIDCIMCGNDNLATMVVRVLSENRLAGSLAVVGQDADLEACQRIVEGTQTMTVYKPVEKLAETAAKAVVDLVTTGSSGSTETINDGSTDVPAIVLDPIAVTRSNIDEVIIGSGFHLKEEVYMNVIE